MAIEYTVRQYPIHGLGACISVMSTLLDTDHPVNLITRNTPGNMFVELKRIFNVADNRLKVSFDESIVEDINEETQLGDYSKFFSPYLTSNTVNLFGKQFGTQKDYKKPCIAICSVNNSEPLQEDYPTDPPYNRYYPKSLWLAVADMALSAGYDVITINKHESSLEQKVFLLNELCDAVITYEGGIAHLAHCLGIPAVILPWKYSTDGTPVDTVTTNMLHGLHRDSKTFIFEHGVDILKYTSNELTDLISNLKQNKGNNIYLGNEWTIKDTVLTNKNNPAQTGPGFGKFEQWFIDTYIKVQLQ